MELRNLESSERYVHVTQSSHERHVHIRCRYDSDNDANSES